MFNPIAKAKELYKYRVLIQSLVSRELKARYRGTILGFLWSFINPMLLLIIYTFVFGYIIPARWEAMNDSPILYALFLFCGVLPWQTWFAPSILESSNVLLMQGNLIKKMLDHSPETFEAYIELRPGKHEITANVEQRGAQRAMRDTVVVELQPGETRRLRLVAGRSRGSPISLRVQ